VVFLVFVAIVVIVVFEPLSGKVAIQRKEVDK
jgi:hypothetical protein